MPHNMRINTDAQTAALRLLFGRRLCAAFGVKSGFCQKVAFTAPTGAME
jgi:hypothetical protein